MEILNIENAGINTEKSGEERSRIYSGFIVSFLPLDSLRESSGIS